MLAISLIVIGIVLRFIPHAPNVTPVAAIALFGGAYLTRKQALIVPLALMMISDSILGMHNVIAFTWGGFVIVTMLGFWLKSHRGVRDIIGGSVVSSLVFYAVTNFGVWLMGWYPHTPAGLLNCYVMGLPFLRDFTLATLVYCAVFFGAYEAIAVRIRNTKLATVLLKN